MTWLGLYIVNIYIYTCICGDDNKDNSLVFAVCVSVCECVGLCESSFVPRLEGKL